MKKKGKRELVRLTKFERNSKRKLFVRRWNNVEFLTIPDDFGSCATVILARFGTVAFTGTEQLKSARQSELVMNRFPPSFLERIDHHPAPCLFIASRVQILTRSQPTNSRINSRSVFDLEKQSGILRNKSKILYTRQIYLAKCLYCFFFIFIK